MLKKIVPILLCLFLNGCMSQTRYTTTLPNIGTYQRTQSYFVERLTSLGWRIFTRQTQGAHIVAANNETGTSRDVVLIELTPNRNNSVVSLWIRTELRNSRGDEWTKPAAVCEGYNWAREQQLLSEILSR
jgi:hypothetical protein